MALLPRTKPGSITGRVHRQWALAPLAAVALVSLIAWHDPQTSPSVNPEKILKTVHFDLAYPAGMDKTALRLAELSEEGYCRISDILMHELTETVRIVVKTGGCDDCGISPSGSRVSSESGPRYLSAGEITVCFSGSYPDFRKSVTRGLARTCIQNMLRAGRGPFGVARGTGRLPQWMRDVLADYIAAGYDDEADAAMREMFLADVSAGIPGIMRAAPGRDRALRTEWMALFFFLERRYGRGSIARVMRAVRDSGSIGEALRSATGRGVNELDREWRVFLETRYKGRRGDYLAGATRLVASPRPGARLAAPVISPDGLHIAYLSCDGTCTSLTVEGLEDNGGRAVIRDGWGRIESIPIDGNRLSWSADGKSILFVALVRDTYTLCAANVSRGIVSLIARLPFSAVMDPSLSPDGKKIVFAGSGGGPSDIFIYDLARRSLTRVTDDDYCDRYPVMTNGNEGVIFSSNWRPGGDPALDDSDIFHINLTTGQRTLLAGGPGDEIQPDLSPDGLIIAYASSRNGTRRLWMHHRDTGRDTVLTGVPEGVMRPRWHPSAGKVVFTTRHGGTEVIALAPAAGNERDPERDVPGDLLPAAYPRSYRDPAGYIMGGYEKTFWFRGITVGAEMMTKGALTGRAGCLLGDASGRHSLSLCALYEGQSGRRDTGGEISYGFSSGRWAWSLGSFFTESPLLTCPDGGGYCGPGERAHLTESSARGGGRTAVTYRINRFFKCGMGLSGAAYILRNNVTRFIRSFDTYEGRLVPSLFMRYDNVVYAGMTPLAGIRGGLHVEESADLSGRGRHVCSISGEVWGHLPITGHSVASLYCAGASLAGPGAGDFMHFPGVWAPMRGYRPLDIHGKHIVAFGFEVLGTIAETSHFGLALPGGAGHFGGVLFFDAVNAWEGIRDLDARGRGKPCGLRMDFGAGIRVAVTPAIILKLDFAWPFDIRRIMRHEIHFAMAMAL